MREGLSRLQAGHIRNCRMRSDIKEDLIGREHTRSSVVQFHLKGFRRYKMAIAHDHFGSALLTDLQLLRKLSCHHLTLAPSYCFHVDSDGTSPRAIVPA